MTAHPLPRGSIEWERRRGEFERAVPLPAQRLVIRLEAGLLHEYAGAAERLIAGEVYIRGGRLVRIGLSPELGLTFGPAMQRDARQAVVLPVSGEYLRRRLSERAEFQVYRRREKEFWPASTIPAGRDFHSCRS